MSQTVLARSEAILREELMDCIRTYVDYGLSVTSAQYPCSLFIFALAIIPGGGGNLGDGYEQSPVGCCVLTVNFPRGSNQEAVIPTLLFATITPTGP